jgi:hypothetical protein
VVSVAAMVTAGVAVACGVVSAGGPCGDVPRHPQRRIRPVRERTRRIFFMDIRIDLFLIIQIHLGFRRNIERR